MREILFRGKRMDNGQWVEGWLYKRIVRPERFHQNNVVFDAIEVYDGKSLFSIEYYTVDPTTVGQYTGLQDKNGKRIFEGDIFKFPDEIFESYYTSCGTEYNSWETENYAVVGFNEYTGGFDFVQYLYQESSAQADLHENHELDFCEFVRGLEVIGNIHDNPELMDGGADHERS